MIFSHQIMVAYVASVLKKTKKRKTKNEKEEEESVPMSKIVNLVNKGMNRALDPGTRVERVNS